MSIIKTYLTCDPSLGAPNPRECAACRLACAVASSRPVSDTALPSGSPLGLTPAQSSLSPPAAGPRSCSGVVDMFAAEKGVDLGAILEVIDLPGLGNRSPETYAQNPTGTVPFVQLTDGTFVSETIAICELLEEEHPEPSLFGSTPSERAATRMWQRRVEQHSEWLKCCPPCLLLPAGPPPCLW